jgi:hypothetical protein
VKLGTAADGPAVRCRAARNPSVRRCGGRTQAGRVPRTAGPGIRQGTRSRCPGRSPPAPTANRPHVRVNDGEYQDRQEHDGQHQHGQGQHLIQPLGCLLPPPRILTASFAAYPQTPSCRRRGFFGHLEVQAPLASTVPGTERAGGVAVMSSAVASVRRPRNRCLLQKPGAFLRLDVGRLQRSFQRPDVLSAVAYVHIPGKRDQLRSYSGRKALVSADGAALC